MRKTAAKVIVGVSIGVVILAGCEKQNGGEISDSEKRSRLIAMENAELKEQLEKQKDNYERQLVQKQQLFNQCDQQRTALAEMSKGRLEGYMSDIVGPLVNENAKLQEQVKNLNTRIAELEAEIEKLKTESKLPEQQ